MIAEVKRASPSQGAIAPTADVAETARAYAAGGAAAISVLCAERDFGGQPGRPRRGPAGGRAAGALQGLHRLSRQVAAQRLAGADAILVILAMVSDDEARRLLQAAELLGMDALVEMHTAAEVERALGLDAAIVGVNARDLDTLEIDRDRQLALVASLPARSCASPSRASRRAQTSRPPATPARTRCSSGPR